MRLRPGPLLLVAALLPPCAWAEPPVSTVRPGEGLQAAVDGAEEGATLVLAPGDHRGPVTVSRRMTLRGEPGARIVGNGKGSVVTIEAAGVELSGLELVRSGRDLAREDSGVLVLGDGARLTALRLRENLHGVYLKGAKNCVVQRLEVIGLAATMTAAEAAALQGARENDGVHHDPPGTQALMGNGVHLWNATGAVVTDNHIQKVRDGIYVAFTHHARFEGNRIHDSRYAIHYMYSSDNVVSGNELWRNVAGAALMFSRNLEVADNLLRDHSGFRAYGLLLQNVDGSRFERNVIRGNRVGMRLQNSSANQLRHNTVAGNVAGMTLNSSSRDNAFTRNLFGPNMRQLELTGPAPPGQWSVDGVGNHWHRALPLDLTGDGISEWPHHEVDLMANRREAFPYVQLLTGSLGVQSVEWALTRAPVPKMRFITDPHPLVREPKAAAP